MESKYLTFVRKDLPNRKTPIVDVINKQGENLGYISFYPQWRKFVFNTYSRYIVIYDSNCLLDIATKLTELQAEWKQSLKENK